MPGEGAQGGVGAGLCLQTCRAREHAGLPHRGWKGHVVSSVTVPASTWGRSLRLQLGLCLTGHVTGWPHRT